ncbi:MULTISPECIES: aspartate kinase [Dictyoglomus]|uniref:Aspartokinase n=1 Tax=Dictyoglomus turgidum (strain DSM 6724 / Z-1310) TaxID=515635 RepID=B8E0J9_DICTD|nr:MULTISPECIES: aspartate kinase [Dictyoglomus]ACK42644.1 aspartate kinase [Dictyoglomus turgidum DSM 6724]HBU31129.1 aspartate kinase [Dictyoglomus sp.]
MSLIVQKYGGTSVGSIERIKNVAQRIAKYYHSGHKLVVVVSAMGDTTDELIDMAEKLNPNPNPREMDFLLSSGERISAALTAMALQNLGIPAIALSGKQAGIMTDSVFTKANIKKIDPKRILEELEKGKVVIVAGFQGYEPEKGDVTTLGRGGSDATAVALAAVLKADICEIYTDVDGIFTADPRVVPNAKKLEFISYEEMLEMASQGAQVMQLRSVDLAATYHVPVVVRSSFNENSGTLIGEVKEVESKQKVKGIAHNKNIAKITIIGVPDKPGIAHKIFAPLGEKSINVDDIVQNVSKEGITDLSFTVSERELNEALKVVQEVAKEIGAKKVLYDNNVGKVSIVGWGIQSTPGIAAKMFGILASEGINIEMITTSEIKITCIIRRDLVEKAVRALHDGFNLGGED